MVFRQLTPTISTELAHDRAACQLWTSKYPEYFFKFLPKSLKETNGITHIYPKGLSHAKTSKR